MAITQNDPRWVWQMDPQRPFGELTAYRGNRQVSDLPFANWTDPGALPQNDGTNQIFLRELDPQGGGKYVYRMRIGKDRAPGSTYLANTWRSEVSNTMMTPVWGTEYWACCGVLLGEDWAPGSPTCTIFELHVPSPQPNPVGISPFGVMCGGGSFIAAVRYNAGVPTAPNDHTLGAQVSIPASRGVWHHFVLNFRLGADNPANFMRIWHGVGDAPAFDQVLNYTGRIGYDANTSARYNYAKHGLYSWTYPWPSSSTSRTIWSKGFRLIHAASPTITVAEMFDLLRTTEGEPPPDPDPEPEPTWQGVVFPALAKFSPIADGSYDSWGVFASTPSESDNSADVFDPTDVEDSTMLIKRNESTASLRTIYIQLTNTSDGSPVTSALSAGDLKISLAGGAEANTDGVATHRGGGVYAYVLTTDEVATGGAGYVRVAKSGCYARKRDFQITAFDPHDDAALGMSRIDTTISSTAPTNVVTAMLDTADTIETGVTLRKAMRALLAVLAGHTTGAGTGTEVFRNAVVNSKARVTTTMTGANRTSITYDLD